MVQKILDTEKRDEWAGRVGRRTMSGGRRHDGEVDQFDKIVMFG